MKWKIALILLILGTVMSPKLILNVWGYKKTSEMMSLVESAEQNRRENKYGEDVAPGTGTLDGDIDIARMEFPTVDRSAWAVALPFSFRDSDEKQTMNKMNRMFDRQFLNGERTVTLTKLLSDEEIFLNGEIEQTPDLLPLIFQARATALLAKKCDLILGDFAKACAVEEARIFMGRAGYELHGKLNYVPNYAMGEGIYQEGNSIVSAHSLSLLPDKTLPADMPTNTPEGHKELLARATRLCDKVIELYGNCIITGMTFEPAVIEATWDEVAEVRTELRAVNGRVRLGSYVPFALDAQETYQADIRALVDAM